MSLHAVPMKLTEAQAFVRAHHRHNRAPAGCLFAVGASDGDQLVGVAIVGRPVARKLDDGKTVEITRCCVVDGAPRDAANERAADFMQTCFGCDIRKWFPDRMEKAK